MLKHILALPVWLVLLDCIYGVVANIWQLVADNTAHLPLQELPMTPDIAFGGFQLMVNGAMAVIVALGLRVLLQLNRTTAEGWAMDLGFVQIWGLLIVVAFSLFSLWEWGWAVVRLVQGIKTVSLENIRYLIVALCLPYIAVLTLVRLGQWYWIKTRPNRVKPVVSYFYGDIER